MRKRRVGLLQLRRYNKSLVKKVQFLQPVSRSATTIATGTHGLKDVVMCGRGHLCHSEIDITQNEECSQNPDECGNVAKFSGGDFHYSVGDQAQTEPSGNAEG